MRAVVVDCLTLDRRPVVGVLDAREHGWARRAVSLIVPGDTAIHVGDAGQGGKSLPPQQHRPLMVLHLLRDNEHEIESLGLVLRPRLGGAGVRLRRAARGGVASAPRRGLRRGAARGGVGRALPRGAEQREPRAHRARGMRRRGGERARVEVPRVPAGRRRNLRERRRLPQVARQVPRAAGPRRLDAASDDGIRAIPARSCSRIRRSS